MTRYRYDEYLDVINVGKKAEYRVTYYVDTLITAMNKKDLPLSPSVPEPHSCCIDIQLLPEHLLDEDYIELVNCTKRHVCRSDGYCKSKKKFFLISVVLDIHLLIMSVPKLTLVSIQTKM